MELHLLNCCLSAVPFGTYAKRNTTNILLSANENKQNKHQFQC